MMLTQLVEGSQSWPSVFVTSSTHDFESPIHLLRCLFYLHLFQMMHVLSSWILMTFFWKVEVLLPASFANL